VAVAAARAGTQQPPQQQQVVLEAVMCVSWICWLLAGMGKTLSGHPTTWLTEAEGHSEHAACVRAAPDGAALHA
jgi:hypothetical protein